MSLASKLSKVPSPVKKRTEPVWEGPNGTGSNGGITYSALVRFLNCRERFRLLVVEGLRPVDTFNHKIFYGNAWHVCEEVLAKITDPGGKPYKPAGWCPALSGALKDYAQSLCREYPLQQQEIDKWYNVCRIQFPLYVDFWSRHPDVIQRTPLLQEQVFSVPYELPSRRTVRLRGKWDVVDLIGEEHPPGRNNPHHDHKECRYCQNPQGIYLQENKTKGGIREQQMVRQLSFDLQVMMYLTALTQDTGIEILEEAKMKVGKGASAYEKSCSAIRGVRYNVIRRPLSGGKGTIVQHKPTKGNPNGESKEDYFARLSGIIEAEPETYFYRWKVEITPADILKFRQQCLDPILEQVCDWWVFISKGDPWRDAFDGNLYYPTPGGLHWRHPFGVWNVLDEGGVSDLDTYLESGSEAGLHRVEQLFTELT